MVFGIEALIKAHIRGEENRRYTESTGLLKTGIIEPVPHVGPHCREAIGYLDWVDIDDCISYTVAKFRMRQAGKTAPKKKRKRANLRTVRKVTE